MVLFVRGSRYSSVVLRQPPYPFDKMRRTFAPVASGRCNPSDAADQGSNELYHLHDYRTRSSTAGMLLSGTTYWVDLVSTALLEMLLYAVEQIKVAQEKSS